MQYKSVDYTNWRVREMCLNGDEKRDKKIWSAYNSMKFFYGENPRASSESLQNDNPKIAFYGACGVCCSELIDNGAPEPIVAAFLCGPAFDHDSLGDYLEMVENGFGERTRYYIEDAMALRLADLSEYNKLLAKGLPEEVLAIETSALWCRIERAILIYQNAERTPDTKFELHEKLLLRADDSTAAVLLQYYDRIAVLLNHIKPDWRPLILNQKVGIAWVTEMVYDTTLWPLPNDL